MALVATDKGGGDFQITPEGTYIGRCIKIIDMGTQTVTSQFGTKEQHKVMISWELLGEDAPLMKDGRPYSVNQFYNVSLHEKSTLRKHLEAWRGKKFTPEELEGFDLANVADTYCMIQVVHDESDKYANVNAIMAYKGTKPKGFNDVTIFDIDNPDMKVFDSFSDNMKGKIMSAPEWKGKQSVTNLTQTLPTEKKDVVITDIDDEPINLDDIPF